MNDFWIYVFLIAMVGILAIFIAIAANRKMKGFRIIVLRDFRNPNKKNVRYWAMFDSRKDQSIKLYSNIFRPMKNKIMPPADMSGYSFDRQVYAFQGVSGHQDDDNIVFIHLPLAGRASANEYSILLSEAIQKTLDFYDAFRLLKIKDESGNLHQLKIGDILDYNNQKYTVTNIDYNGVVLSYDKTVQKRDKNNQIFNDTVRESIRFQNLSDLQSARLIQEPEDAISPNYAQFFNTDWVMQNFGVIPVEDVNVMLTTQKDYISSFNSQLRARAESKMGIFARYPWLLPMSIMTFVVAISCVMIWYAITQDTSQVANTATSAIQHILGLTTTNSTPLPPA